MNPHGPALVQGDERLKRIHFVHPPKSGGTSFGQVIVAAACELNAEHRDYLNCCVDPRDWCGDNCQPVPGCSAVFGCTLCHCHHVPRMENLDKAEFSVTIIRHPLTRVVSGFFYRAHSPNWDRFNVRNYFSKHPIHPFRFSFDEYLGMPEYQNILVKMFARNQFPYFNASLAQADVALASSRLVRFALVGINEAYDASVQLLLRILGVTLREDQIHLPPAMSSSWPQDYEEFKAKLKTNAELRGRILDANSLDLDLYQWALSEFCSKLRMYNLQEMDKYEICRHGGSDR